MSRGVDIRGKVSRADEPESSGSDGAAADEDMPIEKFIVDDDDGVYDALATS